MRDGRTVGTEQRVVIPHEQALADCGQHLLAGDILAPALRIQPGPPGGDGPGSDQDDFPASLPRRDQLRGQRGHIVTVERVVAAGQERRTYFDHHAARPVPGARCAGRVS